MSSAFTPPPVSSWEGPATQTGGFKPPPVTADEGPATPAQKPSLGQQAGEIAKSAGGELLHNLNPATALSGAAQMVSHPIDSLFTPGMKADREQAGKDFSQGNYLQAFTHGLTGSVPILGPISHAALSAADSGDTQGMGKAAGDAISLKAVPAIYGKGTGLLGKAIKAPAGPIAETALGVRKLDRAYGKTPGQAILDETSGVRPSTVADSAQSRLRDIDSQLDAAVAKSPNMADLSPAIGVIQSAKNKALAQNSAGVLNQLKPMEAHLTTNTGNGLPLSPIQPPAGLLNLKRGFGNDFIHNWNPETMAGVRSTAARTYGALDGELDRTVPEAADLNQRSSSLIPVAKRAASTDLNANVLQRTLGRVARPTGALASAITGAYEGGQHFGPLGAIGGGLVGAGLPELLSDPTAQMIAARTLNATGKAMQSETGKATASMLGRGALVKKPQDKE